ncbi:hypothetical protein ACFXAF_34985 [Kitasatospora sp. NPDC059463]|uniref:hypothetical protein n=1 Tax=unclassified Kitasatospora TaxID=2633591 RepID=UPI0036C1E067
MPRRTVLRERDAAGAADTGLLGLVARHAPDDGFHVAVEGVPGAAGRRGRGFPSSPDVGFGERVRRAGRPRAAGFSPAGPARPVAAP